MKYGESVERRGGCGLCCSVDVTVRLPLFCGLCLVSFWLGRYNHGVVWTVLGWTVIACLKVLG